MTFEEKSGIVISQLRADRDRLQETLDKIWTELHRIQPTIRSTDEYRKGVYDGMCYAVDKAIKIIDKYRKGAE